MLPLKPQSVQDFGNGAQSGAAVLAGINTKCCKLRVRPLNSTSTPRRSDGFFLSYIFGAICESFSFLFEESIHCLLQGELSCYIFFSISAGQHSKSRLCLLRLRGMYYRLCDVVCFIIFSLLSLYFLLASYIILDK